MSSAAMKNASDDTKLVSDELAGALGERRLEQMRKLLEGLVGLWEPGLPADLDAILALIPKEHWTLDELARVHESPRVRELAAAIRSAHERSRGTDDG